MARSFTLSNISEQDGKELVAACKNRLVQLDKAFKNCIKCDAQEGAAKVNDRIKIIFALKEKITEELSGEE